MKNRTFLLGGVSISHKNAEVMIREKLALTPPEITEFLLYLKQALSLEEAIVISTCNRTEVYYVAQENIDEQVIKLLCVFKGIGDSTNYRFLFETYQERDAAKQLFMVALGLESQVLGDLEIFGQIKQAYQASSDLDMSGPYLHRLLHSIFYAHKRIHQETAFKDGAASISFNVVKWIEENFDPAKSTKVLVIGAGKMGTDICRNLAHKGYSQISVTNRTSSKAAALAEECGLSTLPYLSHRNFIGNFDFVISTVASPAAPYEAYDFRNSECKALIDVSTPRSVDPQNFDTSIVLANIDDIGQMASSTIKNREKEIPLVEKIIDSILGEFFQWVEEKSFASSVQKFKHVLDELRADTLKSYAKTIDEDQLKIIEEISKKMIQKIVQLPVLQLKSACNRGEADELSESLLELFNVEYKNNVNP